MPFGSRIIIESVSPNPENAKVRFYPIRSVELAFLSIGALGMMWPQLVLPTQLHIDQLELVTQLRDTVGLVRIPNISRERLWVFKCRTTDTKYLYHELKMLLSLDEHENVLPKPEFLVVQQDSSLSLSRVLGMIIPYYPLGNLGQMIERLRKEGTLDFKTKLSWAKQLSTALAWLTTTPMRYYSELKPDNIVCTGLSTIKLIDMEHYGNWETFTAPEIYHVENLGRLSRSNLVPLIERGRYRAMYFENIPNKTDEGAAYSNPEHGYFDAWNILSPERQEAAMIYALGKMMWCIFEGWSHTVNTLDEEYTDDCGWEFPEFHDSPPDIRCIIFNCTKGSPDWNEPSVDRLVRVETKIFPKGRTGREGEPRASSAETLHLSKTIWTERLKIMELYMEARRRWENGNYVNDDAILLGFPLRPGLKDVITTLEKL
ncbi:hypothetical protein N7445_005012 [Penicillium cf. griseofulvum]|nr:hypothetical protein N7445_005012 [Penicillium cf. griseofulvum]